MSLQNDFYNMIKNTKTEKTTAFDTSAEVVRVEDNTIWVHIPGGIDETPIEKTVNAKAGDVVKVREANGRAWITGNSTAPPTDDTVAIDAKETAIVADKKAVVAVEKAEKSEKVASDAHKIASDTNQYFWHTESGTDTGAHITEIPQEEFLEDPSNGGGNLLARSNGIAVRDGLEELSTFSADGVVIGKDSGNQVIVDENSVEMYNADKVKTVDIASSGSTLTQHVQENFRIALTENEPTAFTLFNTVAEPSSGTEVEVVLHYQYNYFSALDDFTIVKGTASSGLSYDERASYVYDGDSTVTITAMSEHLRLHYIYFNIVSDAPYFTLGTRTSNDDKEPYSYALGRELRTGNGQFVIGKFNKYSYAYDVFQIGYGTDDENRKNIFSVGTDGGVKASGGISSMVNTDSTGATFKTTTKTGTVRIRGGDQTDSHPTVTIAHTLSGYYPIALIGYEFTGSHSTWLNVYKFALGSQAVGSCNAIIGVRDFTSGTSYVTPTISTTVLWAKSV